MGVFRSGTRILGMAPLALATYCAVVTMAIVTIAAVWLATHAMVERVATREREDTRHELENYAKTLAGHVERTIGTVDRSLLAIKRDVERGRRAWTAAELATEHRSHGSFVSVLTVTDARGDAISSSIPAKGVNVAGRRHFQALSESDDAGLVLGPPVRGQASGVWTMHAARRLSAQDGSFRGIVSAGLNLDYFAGFYRGIDLGPGGAIEIIGRDGLLRVGEGARGVAPGRAVSDTALFDRIRRGEMRGTDAGVAGSDGAPLIRSYQVIEGYPLIVTVAKPEAEAFQAIAQYRRHAYAYAAGVTLLILALMASTHFLLRRQRGTQAALSGSESRFRALTELTSDWYWETDAEYRFNLMSAGIAHWRTRVPEDYLGKRRWELDFLSPLDGGWERHQETVQARQPFRDFVVRHTDVDGNVSYGSVTGEPVGDALGRHLGYRGVGRDVTAEIRLQQRLKLQHRVSAILANARSARAAVPEVLRAACETFDWQWGARRLTDATTLSCAETWCVPELESSAFARATRETAYRRRPNGVVERALESGEPQWVASDAPGTRRMPLAEAAGLRVLITVPVSCGGHAIGALEFSSSRKERPDALLAGTLRALGEMVGQFLQRQEEIEQRRHAEAVLNESELRFQATFELAAVGIVHTSLDGRFLRVNRKFCETVGYTAEELVGKTSSTFSHPDDASIGVANREQMLRGELDTFSQERRYIRKDGRTIWVNRTVSLARDAAGEPLYFIRVIEDVTARKEAEERYRATFDNAPVGIMHTPLDGYGILRANRKLCEMLGYTQEELLGKTSTELVHPDYRYRDHSLYAQQLLSGEIQSYASERKFVRSDGSSLWVNRTVSLVRDAAGEPLYFIRVLADTSERRRAEEEVERERTLLRTIVDAIPELIHVKDSDGKFLLANRAWLAARGIPDGNVAGTTAGDYFPEATARRMAAQDEAVMRTGEALVNFEQRIDRQNPAGDGVLTRWLSTTKVPLRSAAGTIFGIAGVSRDITESRLSDRRRAMEHAVTRALADSPSLTEAMTKVIRIMCEAMEWTYGARWEAAGRGDTRLKRAEFWIGCAQASGIAADDVWNSMTLDGTPGLVGRAWRERTPCWIADLETGGHFLQRRENARRLGLKSAMAFPILVADESIGILEFFGTETRSADETMFQILGSIGRQVGQFIQRKEAEEALHRSEAILAATFDQAGVGMAISEIAPDNPRWLRVNQKLCDILGRTRGELLAMSPLDLTPPGERRHAVDFNGKLLRDGSASYSREKQYVRKDGQVIWASVSMAAVRGADGRPSCVVSVVQDITEQMRSQRALIESEEQFNQLAGNIPQVFWITDAAHRRVIYVSAACEAVLGYTAAELRKTPRELVGAVHPDDRRRVYEARKSAALGHYDEVYRIVRPDGTTRWLHDRAFPVRDAEGRPYRVAGIAEDITERRRAEDALRESEERFRQAAEALANERNLLRSVIDAIPDDIYVKDRELRYVLMNARALEVRGIRGSREVRGRSAAEFFPPTVSAGWDAEDRAIINGGAPTVNREQDVAYTNGRRETQLATKVPLRDLDGNIVGAIGISRDITQLKERTEEISRLNAELEQRVRERTAELELSNRELESFAFSVSHDLRAPLRTIEGFSRILYNEYTGGIDQEGRDCLRRVQSASQRMARLIDALLSLSRITRSRIRLRPVDLTALAREIGDELEREDPLRRVQFTVEANLTARADASLLRAVFDNLLRNAWKFTAHASIASIEVGAAQHEGRRAYFVRDNGVGFDMNYAGNLFGAFQRLHTEAEFPGTGIGLATVQRIIRRHGGEVWADAAPGKGATFYFTLGEVRPAAKESAGRRPAGLEAASG